MTTRLHQAARTWARRFFAIWAGQAFSLLGSQLVQFALVWWLTSTTKSATVLATATLFAILPQVFISPFAGALVDRWNRRLVMIVADALVALTTVGLMVLYATRQHAGLARLCRHAACARRSARSISRRCRRPPRCSCPSEHLARVSGLNQGLQGLINIVAPPLGALLLSVLPLHNVLAVDIVTAAAGDPAACCSSPSRSPKTARSRSMRTSSRLC